MTSTSFCIEGEYQFYMNLKHHLYDFVNVRHMPHQPYPPELLSSEVPATLQLLHPLIISVTSPCTFFKTILSFLRCKHKSAHSIEGIGVLRFCIAAKLCFFLLHLVPDGAQCFGVRQEGSLSYL